MCGVRGVRRGIQHQDDYRLEPSWEGGVCIKIWQGWRRKHVATWQKGFPARWRQQVQRPWGGIPPVCQGISGGLCDEVDWVGRGDVNRWWNQAGKVGSGTLRTWDFTVSGTWSRRRDGSREVMCCGIFLYHLSGYVKYQWPQMAPQMWMTPPLWQRTKRNWRTSWWKWKRRVKKLAWNSVFKKQRSWHPVPSLHGK